MKTILIRMSNLPRVTHLIYKEFEFIPKVVWLENLLHVLSIAMCSKHFLIGTKIQFSSVTQSCPTLCDTMNCSTLGLPVHHQLQKFTQTQVHWVDDVIQTSHPPSFVSPPGPNPYTSVFSSESTLRMRWPKYWSFSFSISPSNEHPGLISFRMD